MNNDQYKEQIEELQKQLAAKEELLNYTRQYADNLLAQVNVHVEELQSAQEKVMLHNKTLTSSIACASHVLEKVMTPHDYFLEKYPNSFIMSRPRDVIGGDFFWMQSMKDVNFWAVADCTGHGVSGAMLSMMGEMLLKQAVLEKNIYEPDKILCYLDQQIKDSSVRQQKDDFHVFNNVSDLAMDMLVGLHDKRRNEVYIASAHMPYLVYKDGEVQRMKGCKFSVGVTGRGVQKEFAVNKFKLEPNMSFYFFSDGFADQKTPKKKIKLGRVRLERFIKSNAKETFEEQKRRTTKLFRMLTAHNEQVDDVLVLGVDFLNQDRPN